MLHFRFMFPHMYIHFEGCYHQQNIMIFPHVSRSYSIKWHRAGHEITINITHRNPRYITSSVVSKNVTMIYNRRVLKYYYYFLDKIHCPMIIFDNNMTEPKEVSFEEYENYRFYERITEYQSYIERFRIRSLK